MDRGSCIFYRSFYESIKELTPEQRVQIYDAIFKYEFDNEEVELTGVCKSIFTLIIPQLEANNKRYTNGCKGGRPKNNQKETKTKPNENQKETKTKANYNENENENYNENENDNDNDVYTYIEENFGRTLSPIEYEVVSQWEDNELTRYAIKEAVLNGAKSMKYIQAILDNWKDKGITTIQQAQKKKTKEPSWLDKEIESEEMTPEEETKFRERLKL